MCLKDTLRNITKNKLHTGLRTQQNIKENAKMSQDLYDFAAELVRETDLAVLLDCGEAHPIWFPKSLTEDNGDGTWTVPEWLAEDKGIV